MTGVLLALPGIMAQLLSGAALLAGVLTLAATRKPALALSVFLDLLTAAGLLRLVGDPSWQAIATAGLIVGLRHLIGLGLRIGARNWTGSAPGLGRSGPRPGVVVDRLLRPAWRR